MLFIPFHNLSNLANYLGSVHSTASTAFANAVVATGDKLKAIGFGTTKPDDQLLDAKKSERDGILRDMFLVPELEKVNTPLSFIRPSELTSSRINQLSSTDVIEIFKGDRKKFTEKKDNLMGFNNFKKVSSDVVFRYGGKSGFTLTVKDSLVSRGKEIYELICRDGSREERLFVTNQSEEGNLITLMLDIANRQLAWGQDQRIV